MLRSRIAGPLCLALVSLSACTVGPDYERPEIQMPDAWFQELSQGLETGQSDLHNWWRVFEDPLLEELILEAASSNLDLKIALQRVEEARALRGVAASVQWPDVSASGGVGRTRTGAGSLGVAGSNGVTTNTASVGIDATWELDVWGRVRRVVESADASLEAVIEGYRDVLVLLFAEVASNYYELRTLQARIAVAEQNLELQRETVQLVKDRRAADLVPELDVQQAEYNLFRTQALVPELRAALAQRQHRLGVLLGGWPSKWADKFGEASKLPEAPEKVAVGLPRELLRQRPDLRRAERELAAQVAQIGVATAELYPQFRLDGFFSYAMTSSTSPLFDDANRNWGISLPVRWSIFSGDRVQSQIRTEEARAAAALESYRQTALLALEDVENAITTYVESRNGADESAKAVNALRESTKLTRDLYKQGLVDFQRVLDSERALFDEQDRLVSRKGLSLGALIQVFRALGGGWDPEAEQQ
jgi:multidrug efflux system outer membrane protein